jgi:hypothetical protein
VDEIAAIDEDIWELKVWKIASEPPIEDAQVILQILLWVKLKYTPANCNLRLLTLEKAKQDSLEDTAS